jgi:hypothetical protein
LAAFYLANVFAILIAGMFSGSSLHVFPVNVYFWLMVGLLCQIIETDKQERREEARASASGPVSGADPAPPFRRGPLVHA